MEESVSSHQGTARRTVSTPALSLTRTTDSLRLRRSRTRYVARLCRRSVQLADEALYQDIPEGGSKGVILPDIGASPRQAFEKYVDSIIDLLIPGRTPGIKESIVDLYKKEEIVSSLPLEHCVRG